MQLLRAVAAAKAGPTSSALRILRDVMPRPVSLLSPLLAIAVALAGCTTNAPPASPQSPVPASPGTEAPTASASPPPTSTPVAYVIERATTPTPPDASALIDVVAAGDGRLVAIGFDGQMGSFVWLSDDGAHTWTEAADPALSSAGMAAAVALDDRLVAVGRDPADIETNLAAAWISEDAGDTWRRAEGGSALADGQLIDVVAAGPGLVAIGGLPGADAAAVWTSADGGETWQRSPDADSFAHAFMWAVAEGGPGLVAVGWRRNPEPDLAVWTSADGQDWALAADPELGEGFQGLDVLSRDDGTVVMVGELVNGGTAGAWFSTDGEAWEAAEDADGSFTDGSMRRVIATPDGLLAFGSIGLDGAVWSSADGRSWRLAASGGPALTDGYITAAVATADGVALVGGNQQRIEDTESFTQTAAAWVGAPAPR